MDIGKDIKLSWADLRFKIVEEKESNEELREDLFKLLSKCKSAGEKIVDPAERSSLQKTAREIGDKIFALTGEYPLTAIKTAEPPEPESSVIFSLPHRNPFFTGREDILQQLYEILEEHRVAALSGLGGIGKTETAIEYAYRHRDEYRYVLQVQASSRDALDKSFTTIADILKLPARGAQFRDALVDDVKKWLESKGRWLLIFDSADNPEMVREFIPTGEGHVLLTTRNQATGSIPRIEIKAMAEEEGMLFLLRRAKIITMDKSLDVASEAERDLAKALCQKMNGIPLALDQAAAYIEETACGLSGYLDLYHEIGTKLLEKRGSELNGYTTTVTATWMLSFENIAEANSTAADLLRLCAFLHPDAIPEEILTKGGQELGPILEDVAADPLNLNTAIGETLKYSLLHRDSNTKTLKIHRLVQTVLKNAMNNNMQRQWAERAVRVVNHVFPEVDFENWDDCDRLLPHAVVCAELILKWEFEFPEVGRLLHQTGRYLFERGHYIEAEPLYQRALKIREKIRGPEHLDVAESLKAIAELYIAQGRYAEAEPLVQRALNIRETLDPDSLAVAITLDTLAWLYANKARYAEAEQLIQRALKISEKVGGHNHPTVATSLNTLAWCYSIQARYDEAEPLVQRALAIREKISEANHLGANHPRLAWSLDTLALIYVKKARHDEAEPLVQRALMMRERILGVNHPHLASSLDILGELYCAQGRYDVAKPLLDRSLTIRERVLGPDHPDVAWSYHGLARLYYAQHRYIEAEQFRQTALEILEKVFGPEHPVVATVRENKEFN